MHKHWDSIPTTATPPLPEISQLNVRRLHLAPVPLPSVNIRQTLPRRSRQMKGQTAKLQRYSHSSDSFFGSSPRGHHHPQFWSHRRKRFEGSCRKKKNGRRCGFTWRAKPSRGGDDRNVLITFCSKEKRKEVFEAALWQVEPVCARGCC